MAIKTIKENRIKKGAVKEFFQKLSRGLMLPIALLPIAGLFLGVGAGIENVMIQNGVDPLSTAMLPFTIIKQIGDVIFGNLPVLFAIGIAIAFTEDAGVAALAGFVGWVVFNQTQNALIWDYGVASFELISTQDPTQILSVRGDEIVEVLAKEGVIIAGLENIIADYTRYLGSSSSVVETAVALINDDGTYVVHSTTTVVDSYGALWFRGTVPSSVIGTNVGIKSMQTSVFGGIALGSLVAFLYNKFHTFQMPKVLGFFSGTRFVPIITFLLAPVLGMLFLMLWPIIGIGLDTFGKSLASAPAGVDAMAFGYIERILIPFGLHHAFYTPLWYTSVGGELTLQLAGEARENAITLAQGNQSIWFALTEQGVNFKDITSAEVINGFHKLEMENGDIYRLTAGVNPGAYMQGKFPFMMFGLPAAGAAMIMAAKKENRQMAISIIGAAAFTSFLTGITEPIEFTFLFLAPWLFFGFHAVMASASFWVLDLVGAHVGMTFSGGIFDIILFGVLPDVSGMNANHWHIYWLGAIYAPIYYFVFYFAITKFDLATPGRVSSDVSLKSKADYKAKKEAEA